MRRISPHSVEVGQALTLGPIGVGWATKAFPAADMFILAVRDNGLLQWEHFGKRKVKGPDCKAVQICRTRGDLLAPERSGQ